MWGCYAAEGSSCSSSRSSSRCSSPDAAPQSAAPQNGSANGIGAVTRPSPASARKLEQLCPAGSTLDIMDRFEMPDYVEDMKRGFLIQPGPGETEEECRQKLFESLEDDDRLNRELMSTYSHFERGDGRVHGWDDIPPADPNAKKIALMFMVMDTHRHEALWREWLRRADAEGHANDYSIVYHRGGAYGKSADTIKSDMFAEKGVPVWPATKTGWARNGLARATLLLYRFALEDPGNRWFVLLSDHCMPLYSFHEIHRRISREELSRFNDFGMTLDIAMRRDIWQPGYCTTIRKSNKADQWSMMIRQDAEWFVKEKHYQHLKRWAVFVDEAYFINMMDQFGRPYKRAPTTYTTWWHPNDLPGLQTEDKVGALRKMGGSPHTFKSVDMRLIQTARRGGAWFMRKVAPGAAYPELDELEVDSDDEVPTCMAWH
eukprot:gb/GFBE01049258.1/.p1 GENE.gb/GFBE01049258.1/~~gb/GFBE01049258.1/.p1  ORF type:complete len:431 (+),score=74.95 gb/GFBE01049258.1/:1-1293(+)